MVDNNTNIKLLPKQYEFLTSTKREILYSGGYASGKTRALCYAAVKHALIPNNLVLLTRKTRASLKTSTLRTLLESESGLPPVLPVGTYEYNRADSVIKINGGGIILYKGFDDPLSIRSINAGTVCIDEGVELEEVEYLELFHRLRNSNDPNPQILIATNPSSQFHFLYKRFFHNPDSTKQVIQATTLDNFFLPESYLEGIRKLQGVDYKRYCLGEWVNNEKAIFYGCYNPDEVFKHKDFPKANIVKPFPDWYIGLDVGYNDPTAWVFCSWKDNRMHIYTEYYRSGMLPSEISKELEVYKTWNPLILIDPSAAGIRAELESNGYRVEKANNSINEGILRIKDLFYNKVITAEPLLPHLRDELENYSYKDGTDNIKQNGKDHLIDGLRYVVNYLKDKDKYIEPSVFVLGDDAFVYDDD